MIKNMIAYAQGDANEHELLPDENKKKMDNFDYFHDDLFCRTVADAGRTG